MDRDMDSVIGDLIRKPVRRRPALSRLGQLSEALKAGRSLDDVTTDMRPPAARAQAGGVPETPPPADSEANIPISRLVLNARRFLDASWRAIATRRTPSPGPPEALDS